MIPLDNSLQKLLAAARRAPPREADEAAPFGFATRVAALAFGAPAPAPSIFGRLALRAAAVAALLAVAAVVANYTAIRGALEDTASTQATDDPVTEVVDLGS
jgi:hypothetical protein